MTSFGKKPEDGLFPERKNILEPRPDKKKVNEGSKDKTRHSIPYDVFHVRPLVRLLKTVNVLPMSVGPARLFINE